jgi:hypothetical protein
MKRVISLLFVLFLVGMASFAQTAATPANCSLVGAWYGGSPDTSFPYYQAAITPNDGDRYSIVYQYWGGIPSPYMSWTDWKGDIVKKSGKTYTGVFFQMQRMDPTSPDLPPGVDGNLPELDFIHIDHLEFIDCNTFRVTYDKWYVYYNFTNDIKPLQPPPPPGYIWIIDPPLVEVYHRIPSAGSGHFLTDLLAPDTQIGRGPLPPKAMRK